MSSADKRAEVVITGLGMVTPLGSSPSAFYAALRSGRCAIEKDRTLNRAQDVGFPTEPALARIGDFGAATAIEAGRRRRMPRLGQFCVVAAQQAIGLLPTAEGGMPVATSAPLFSQVARERIGVVLGTGLGALDLTLEFMSQYIEGGLGVASPASFPYTVMNASSAIVAMELGLLGPNITINHRDLSLAEAVASGCDQLVCGHIDAALVGGCDELGSWLLHAYQKLGALSKNGALLPYDRERDGLCPGEGAVLLLLERAADAAARGATVLARVSGIGRTSDDRARIGWRRSGEEPNIGGAANAVLHSLRAAGLLPTDIDFVSGSGNGTELDRLETRALRQALGAAAEKVRIASILGQTGEWMTSAGVRLATAIYALNEQAVPGTRCQKPDPEAALPGLCLSPQPLATRHVLIPTFAQGGGNLALVLSRP